MTASRSLLILGIAFASAAGGLTRYAIQHALPRANVAAFPWATFLVNISGAFLLGFLFVFANERLDVPPWLKASVFVGFLGSYTTFSTFTLDSWRLIEEGAYGVAATNVLASVGAGLGATAAGILLARAFV